MCIEKIPAKDFTLNQMYSFENELKAKHPENNFIKDKIRQQLQYLRDKDFIEFLCNLIQYSPNERLDFEKIIRNKWLNKDLDKLHEIFWGFEYDEEKLIMELQKNDYLIKKEDKINKKPSRFRFKKNKNDK